MHVHAEVLQHALHGLLGERGVAKRVAGAAQADDQPVADELAVPRAAQHRDVLDPGRGGARGGDEERKKRDQVRLIRRRP